MSTPEGTLAEAPTQGRRLRIPDANLASTRARLEQEVLTQVFWACEVTPGSAELTATECCLQGLLHGTSDMGTEACHITHVDTPGEPAREVIHRLCETIAVDSEAAL